MNNPASFDGGGNQQWPAQRQSGNTNGGAETPVTAGASFADPLLPGAAANNGGFVPTLAAPANSPLINSGVASVAGSGTPVPPTDARGEPRVGAVDRGSFERQPDGRIFFDGFETP
nr:choice-of-anchor Q domain-containing protein [Lysobacter sp. CAU 1642]